MYHCSVSSPQQRNTVESQRYRTKSYVRPAVSTGRHKKKLSPKGPYSRANGGGNAAVQQETFPAWGTAVLDLHNGKRDQWYWPP